MQQGLLMRCLVCDRKVSKMIICIFTVPVQGLGVYLDDLVHTFVQAFLSVHNDQQLMYAPNTPCNSDE
jgi:hypothetical protein